MRVQFVEAAKVWWKLWSIRLGALGSIVVSVLVMFPDKALEMWAIMPEQFKSFIPPEYMPLAGVIIYVIGMFARFVKQHKLDKDLNRQ